MIYFLTEKNLFDQKNFLLTIFEEYQFFDMICNNLVYLSSITDQIDFSEVRKFIHYSYFTNSTLNERRIFILYYQLKLINIFISTSIDLRIFLVEKNGLMSFINFIKNHKFIEKLFQYSYLIASLCIYNMNWLSKNSESNKEVWNELKTIDTLLEYSKKFPFAKTFVYMIICNIADDKDIESLPEINQIIDIFCELTIKCVNEWDGFGIVNQFLDEDGQTKHEICVRRIHLHEERVDVSSTGLLLSLYRISLNDKIKWDLYKKPGLTDAIKRLIYEGTEPERQFSLEYLTQLCFDQRVIQDLSKDTDFYNFIKQLSEYNDIQFKKLATTCRQYLWLMKSKTSKVEEKNTVSSLNGHIMISYNSQSRELCLKIKSFLESQGYKIWIDVEEIHGSSLDSMARAIEESQFVLICVTEKYRQSLNCQSEAQYAFRLNKNIIPLIMQKGYASVNGWLGFIIGDKIFIDFTKYPLEECFKRLQNQIVLKTNNSQVKVGEIPLGLSMEPTKANKKEAIEWNESKVEEWFINNNFEEFYEILRPLNGANLFQLYQLQIHTPEFFYKSLTKNDKANVKSLILFSTSLKNLFE